MYPRNAASPPEIAVGAVVQISDGAVQTSGTTTKVKQKGGSWSAAGGTTAFGDGGTATYTPTQAETNTEEFIVEVYKSGCIPASVTVVTTESPTAGRVSLGSILGTTLTETSAGYLAAAFKKFFDKASPTGTINSLPDAVPDAAGGLPISDAGGLDIDTKLANTNEVTAARMGALTDLIDGGRLDLLIDAIKLVLDRLATGMELDGAVYRFTTNALEQAPTGGSAPSAADIRAEIDSSSTRLASIDGKTTNLPSDPADESLIIAATDAIMTRLGVPTGASVSVDIAGITSNLSLIAPTTDAADSATLTTGTEIAGTYVKTQTDDNDPYTLAPVNPGGLDLLLVFEIGLGRAPVSIAINGYWSGNGRYCDVYAYDYVIGVWDKLTNSSTRMNHRTSDANYTYPLNREHIDPGTGDVSIRFVSPSITTADRLRLDRVVVGTIDSSTGASTSITAQDVWGYVSRTLTSTSGEPIDTDAIAAAVAALILVTPAQKVVTDASGYVTANVSGSVSVTGEVTLAASQPNYAPAKAGDAMALTSGERSTLVAAVWSATTRTLTAFGTLIADLWSYVARTLTALPTGSATSENQEAILEAVSSIEGSQTTIINNTETIITNTETTINNTENITTIIQGGGTGAGSGSVAWPITVQDSNGDPLADVDVVIVAVGDPDGDPVASGKTDSYGVVVPEPRLDPGSYYVYRQKTGENFNNPATITVT